MYTRISMSALCYGAHLLGWPRKGHACLGRVAVVLLAESAFFGDYRTKEAGVVLCVVAPVPLYTAQGIHQCISSLIHVHCIRNTSEMHKFIVSCSSVVKPLALEGRPHWEVTGSTPRGKKETDDDFFLSDGCSSGLFEHDRLIGYKWTCLFKKIE